MDQTNNKLSKIASVSIMAIGAVMFVAYLLYLPNPTIFGGSQAAQNQAHDVGLILYSLATAGCGFIAWGMMLMQLDANGVTKTQLLKASGIGFLLLALMRLGTASFPHEPFYQLRAVPIAECIVFSLIGIKFYRG